MSAVQDPSAPLPHDAVAIVGAGEIAKVAPVYKGNLKVDIGDVTDKNIESVKVLNKSIFPISYNGQFYTDVLKSGALSRLAFFNIDMYAQDVPAGCRVPSRDFLHMLVGAVCTRVEAGQAGRKNVYILSLGVLAPYRSCKIGSALLQCVLDAVDADPTLGQVYLHVQVSNADAIAFYEKFGFQITETIPGYYKRLTPSDCHKLTRDKK